MVARTTNPREAFWNKTITGELQEQHRKANAVYLKDLAARRIRAAGYREAVSFNSH